MTPPLHRARGRETRHLVAASGLVSGLGILAKLIGIARERVVAGAFGATRLLDSFQIAKVLPDMFSTWIEMPVRAAFVPVFTRRLEQDGEPAAWRAASNVINALALLLAALVAVLWIAAPVLVRTFSPGFDDPQAWHVATEQARIVVVSIAFSVLAVVLGSLQNVYRRQLWPALGRVANAAVLLGAIALLADTRGLTAYSYGIVAGAAAMFALQLGIVFRHRRHYRFAIDPRAPEIREVLAVALPLFIGLTGTRVDALLDRVFASYLPAGHLSLLLYGIVLTGVVTDLVLTVSANVLLPSFARMIAEGREADVRARLGQALEGTVWFMAPFVALLVAGSRRVVALIYEGGAFTAEQADLLALLLPVLALVAPVYGASQITAQVYIGSGDARTPMVAGLWRIGFKLILTVTGLALLWRAGALAWGVFALAGASSASTLFRFGLMWRWLPAPLRPEGAPLARRVARLAASGVAAGLASGLVLSQWPSLGPGRFGTGVALALAGIAGGAVHVALSEAFGPGPLRRVLRAFAGRR